MAQKAQDYINQGKTNLSEAVSCLQQALGAAEKAENKYASFCALLFFCGLLN